MTNRTPIADLLEQAGEVATDGIIRSSSLSRKHREALVRAGWLRRIIRGWYLLLQPTDGPEASTAWYASVWTFASLYLASRLDDDYCLSAQSSLDLHLGPMLIPQQIIVIAGRGGSTVVNLPEQTSILTYQNSDTLPKPEQVETVRGVRAMSLPLALARVGGAFFERQPESSEIALRMLGEPSALIRILVSGESVSASERLAGAFEFLGENETSDRIQKAMEAAGKKIRPKNPFHKPGPVFGAGIRIRSPYAARVRAHWENMRGQILDRFKLEAKPMVDVAQLLERVEAAHVEDAYHSLSIEGYRVTADLITRIREGNWDPDTETNRPERNALAAKGYNEAFNLVRNGIRKIAGTTSPASVVNDSIQAWYGALFSASVSAGLVAATDLAGYRNGPVYIRGAQHVPPPRDAVADAMESYAECMTEEESAVVRAVLGHFLFVWIHPFPDGNGRIARFIMNTMLVTGGFPWTVIRVDHRDGYMQALESASSSANIVPFVELIEKEARASLNLWER